MAAIRLMDLICRRLIYDPSEWQIEEDEAISRMKTEELDRLVAGP